MTTILLSLLLQAQRQPEYLVLDGLVIGYRQSGAWHNPDKLPNKKAPIFFQGIGLGSASGSYKATGMTHETDGPEGLYLDGPDDRQKGVLFSGNATFPRPVKVLSNQNETYLKALGAFLRSHGVRSKPRLTRVISADLDGSGSNQVILEGSSRDDLARKGPNQNRPGDYSVILLRYLKGGTAVSKAILFDHARGDELAYMDKVVAVGDFDGDGTMEFVVTSDYYEGGKGVLVRFRRGKISALAEYGAGA